ncbi:MAG: hypothetical protein GY861_28760 [bacterium]|nr:hypothetical protein [bacterium]
MAHDFNKFPELTNNQMNLYYFDSPHQQITDDFDARVVKVVDGDTVRVECPFRNFDFPIRFSNIMAAEMNESGKSSRDHLSNLVLNREVEVIIDKNNRVGKYGRLLGQIRQSGFDVGEQMKTDGYAVGVWQEQMGIKDLMVTLDI